MDSKTGKAIVTIAGVAHDTEWKDGKLVSVTFDGKKIDINHKPVDLDEVKSWDEVLPTKEHIAFLPEYDKIAKEMEFILNDPKKDPVLKCKEIENKVNYPSIGAAMNDYPPIIESTFNQLREKAMADALAYVKTYAFTEGMPA